jgi:hypothetical protein
MKNTKKITGILLAIVAVVVPLVTFASTLNNDPQDFATLRVANNTLNSIGCTTCWGISTNASPGNTVSFAIYYHNTGPTTATNVRVRLTPQSTALGTTQVFTATVSADNAPSVTGTATVYLSSAQTITYDGTTYWYPYNSNPTTSVALPAGQTGAELFDGIGLNIGNVAAGWTMQGSVTANFHVSSAPLAKAPTVATTAATSITQLGAILNGSVTPNGASTTSWFEWGKTTTLGNSTPTHFEGSGSTANVMTATLLNLTPSTTYYFRAVAQNSQGTTYGDILSFQTGGSPANPPLGPSNPPLGLN